MPRFHAGEKDIFFEATSPYKYYVSRSVNEKGLYYEHLIGPHTDYGKSVRGLSYPSAKGFSVELCINL